MCVCVCVCVLSIPDTFVVPRQPECAVFIWSQTIVVMAGFTMSPIITISHGNRRIVVSTNDNGPKYSIITTIKIIDSTSDYYVTISSGFVNFKSRMNVLLVLCCQSEKSIPGTFSLEHQLVGPCDPDTGRLEPISSSVTRCS